MLQIGTANGKPWRGIWAVKLVDGDGIHYPVRSARRKDLANPTWRRLFPYIDYHYSFWELRFPAKNAAGESLSAFKKVMDEASRRGLAVQMGYMFRNNPGFQLCFRAIREGWLGTVFELHAQPSGR